MVVKDPPLGRGENEGVHTRLSQKSTVKPNKKIQQEKEKYKSASQSHDPMHIA